MRRPRYERNYNNKYRTQAPNNCFTCPFAQQEPQYNDNGPARGSAIFRTIFVLFVIFITFCGGKSVLNSYKHIESKNPSTSYSYENGVPATFRYEDITTLNPDGSNSNGNASEEEESASSYY